MCTMKVREWPSGILKEIYSFGYFCARVYLWSGKIRVQIKKCSLKITPSEENLSCGFQFLFDYECKILTFKKISNVIHSPSKCHNFPWRGNKVYVACVVSYTKDSGKT